MAKTIFEELGGKYERQGDYLIPCLAAPAEEEHDPRGSRQMSASSHLARCPRVMFFFGGCSQARSEERRVGKEGT